MRPAWWPAAALGLLAASCLGGSSGDGGTGGVASPVRTNPLPSGPAISQAADLRTHFDLLLAEHTMLIAKESAGAANHSDEYASYTALLSSNLTDLAGVIRTAFGNTAGDNFTTVWTAQNSYLVDYGIGVVTHNDTKSGAALNGLTGDSEPKLATFLTDISGLPNDQLTQTISQQVIADKTFIDDVAAQKYPNFYADLQTAYLQSARLGDALAARIAQKFPDKFPGDPTIPQADRRVSLNMVLQEHAWLATLATDAVVAQRDQDKTAAAAALGSNEEALSRSVTDQFGASSGQGFIAAWSARDSGLLTYAEKGDADSKKAVTDTVAQFATVAHVSPALVGAEMNALLKVVDDQRAKDSKDVAGDDRASATSMQPVADAIVTAT